MASQRQTDTVLRIEARTLRRAVIDQLIELGAGELSTPDDETITYVERWTPVAVRALSVLTALVCTGIAIAVWIRDLANPFVQSRNALPEFIFLLVVALVALIAPIGIRATATFLVRISASGDNSCVHVARDGSKAGQDLYIEFVLAVNRAIDACLERADTGGSKGLV